MKKRSSLSRKVNILLALIIAAIATGLIAISYNVYCRKVNDIYYEQVERAAYALSRQIHPLMAANFTEQIKSDEFRERREEAETEKNDELLFRWMRTVPGYWESLDRTEISSGDEELPDSMSLYGDYLILLSTLELIEEEYGVNFTSLVIREDTGMLLLADSFEPAYKIGTALEVPDELKAYDAGERIPATICSKSYGLECTAYEPVMDYPEESGSVLACCDIDMGIIQTERSWFLFNSILFVFILTAAGILISILVMKRIATKPLKKLAFATAAFKSSDEGYTMADVTVTDTGANDEIGELSFEIRDMQRRIIDGTNHLKQVTAERERITTELELAAKIQANMLPREFPAFPDRTEFDIFASMTPAKEVGGDFYDFFLVDDDHLALVIADVSGKGIPAALFMMMAKSLIRNYVMAGHGPQEAIDLVNKEICANNKEKMFVTVWLGILEISAGKLTAVNAGHEYPIVKTPGGSFEVLKDEHGFVVGGFDFMKYEEYELYLEPGSKLFVYTDGVPEATADGGGLFGMERTVQAAVHAQEGRPEEILSAVDEAVKQFIGDAEQFDDLTMLCLEYKGKEEKLNAEHNLQQ